jgi:hypothetical protein
MKSLAQFMIESSFRRDNPGGDWLEYRREEAEEHYAKRKGLHGGTTGYFTKTLHLPVSHLSSLEGVMGEHKFRDSGPKQERVANEIGHPSNFNTKDYPIMVGINHKGVPYVMEGNHRLAYAKKHGISHIHAEVKYYNGGEDHEGPYSPKSLLKLHKAD